VGFTTLLPEGTDERISIWMTETEANGWNFSGRYVSAITGDVTPTAR